MGNFFLYQQPARTNFSTVSRSRPHDQSSTDRSTALNLTTDLRRDIIVLSPTGGGTD